MDELINRNSEAYKQIVELISDMDGKLDELSLRIKPAPLGESFWTGEELCEIFRFTPRTLQNYRDNGVIPFTTIGGKILYPRKMIMEILEQNYKPTIKR